mgnify:CR=1 FL=1
MKKTVLIIALVFMTLMMSAQTYGVDQDKKIIVVSERLPEGVKPYKETHQVRGENYTCYRSELPLITITTDGEIVNTPAVHGTISVTDADGNVITMHAGFKIRGTSSQQYDKKSYRVELWADETGTVMADTTFLGLQIEIGRASCRARV